MNSSSVFQFRIALKRCKPRIYRDIQVPMDMDFYAFHVAIQDAMGWKDCHLFQFSKFSVRPNETSYTIGYPYVDELFGFEIRSARGLLIGDYFKSPKDKALYAYDFGDGWEHEVKLMKLPTKDLQVQYPRCVGGQGVCPPEDSGGPACYEEHLAIISNPRCKKYKEYMRWLRDIRYDVTVTTFDHSSVVMTDAEEVEEQWKARYPTL